MSIPKTELSSQSACRHYYEFGEDASLIRYDRRALTLAVGLSVLAGYVDASGFLATGGLFVSFMTGNSTRLGVAASEGSFHHAGLLAGVVGLFVVGVVVGTLMAQRAASRRKAAVLVTVASLLVFSAVAKLVGWYPISSGLLILAMGAANATFQRDGEVSIGVTYMTGTLVKFGQRLAAWLGGGKLSDSGPYLLLWIGMILGAIAGAVAHRRLPDASLWLASAYAFLLAWFASSIRTSPPKDGLAT